MIAWVDISVAIEEFRQDRWAGNYVTTALENACKINKTKRSLINSDRLIVAGLHLCKFSGTVSGFSFLTVDIPAPTYGTQTQQRA